MQTFLPFQRHGTEPLAHSKRPQDLSDFVGQDAVISDLVSIDENYIPHIILWGPPGSGKTTLAHLMAQKWQLELFEFNAVMSGIPELRKLIQACMETKSFCTKKSIIFIDEIHRFNKAQQDALLPHLEKGHFILIGATTEYPQTSLNRAVLSRVKLMNLTALTNKDIQQIINKVIEQLAVNIKLEQISLISDLANGDARMAINFLEALLYHYPKNITLKDLEKKFLEQSRYYDQRSSRHYDVISAFIKSVRGSDVDSALLWLAVMLDGGEDPKFIARRLIILASEDIGLADQQALVISNNVAQAIEKIGMPEARILLSHATIYCARAKKSNLCYLAIDKALDFVKSNPTLEVPDHLKNRGDFKNEYLYPHDYPDQKLKQDYFAKNHPRQIFFRELE